MGRYGEFNHLKIENLSIEAKYIQSWVCDIERASAASLVHQCFFRLFLPLPKGQAKSGTQWLSVAEARIACGDGVGGGTPLPLGGHHELSSNFISIYSGSIDQRL